MKIKRIEIFNVNFPLIKPFIVSYATYPTMPSIIVKITTEDGFVGWGESVPDEHVTGETYESTFEVLKQTLSPMLIGENPLLFEKIHERMDQAVKGVPAAKAAIDIACFDLAGKKLGVPV